MGRVSFWLGAVVGLPLLLGCGEQHFRAETVWRADGRVERAVYQPAQFFPEAARSGWAQIQPAGETPADAFVGRISDVPAAAGDAPYFAASGTFLSPAQIPDHV